MPEELAYDPHGPLPDLTGPFHDDFRVTFADGSRGFIPKRAFVAGSWTGCETLGTDSGDEGDLRSGRVARSGDVGRACHNRGKPSPEVVMRMLSGAVLVLASSVFYIGSNAAREMDMKAWGGWAAVVAGALGLLLLIVGGRYDKPPN
jgi:hypothetical protein